MVFNWNLKALWKLRLFDFQWRQQVQILLNRIELFGPLLPDHFEHLLNFRLFDWWPQSNRRQTHIPHIAYEFIQYNFEPIKKYTSIKLINSVTSVLYICGPFLLVFLNIDCYTQAQCFEKERRRQKRIIRKIEKIV